MTNAALPCCMCSGCKQSGRSTAIGLQSPAASPDMGRPPPLRAGGQSHVALTSPRVRGKGVRGGPAMAMAGNCGSASKPRGRHSQTRMRVRPAQRRSAACVWEWSEAFAGFSPLSRVQPRQGKVFGAIVTPYCALYRSNCSRFDSFICAGYADRLGLLNHDSGCACVGLPSDRDAARCISAVKTTE
jgi:hypothetical protein